MKTLQKEVNQEYMVDPQKGWLSIRVITENKEKQTEQLRAILNKNKEKKN